MRTKGTASDVIDMVSSMEARVSQLERLHAEHHSNAHQFDDVTFVSCDLQQVLATQKIVNMVGQIDSKSLSCCNTNDHRQGTSSNIIKVKVN